jgi:MFS family permease
MSPVAGAISGIIAYGLEKNLDNALGFHAWQWLFIIEGVATIVFALVVIVLLPGLPDSVVDKGSFLFRHKNEGRLLLQRTKASKATLQN